MSDLERLVNKLRYKPGWSFALEIIRGKVHLGITTVGFDTFDFGNPDYSTHHIFEVPHDPHPVSWQRWLFDRIGDVDLHERMELFRIGDDRPFAPQHSRREGNYYTVVERAILPPHGEEEEL